MIRTFVLLLIASPLVVAENYEHTCDIDEMLAALEQDDRYVAHEPVSDSDRKNLHEVHDSLDPDVKRCVEKIVDANRSAFIEHCQDHGCYQNIGGQCAHMAGSQDWLYVKARELCSS